jgi:hypothetical protein
VNISNVTKKPKTISNHEKQKTPPQRKREKPDQNTELNVQFGQQH